MIAVVVVGAILVIPVSVGPSLLLQLTLLYLSVGTLQLKSPEVDTGRDYRVIARTTRAVDRWVDEREIPPDSRQQGERQRLVVRRGQEDKVFGGP